MEVFSFLLHFSFLFSLTLHIQHRRKCCWGYNQNIYRLWQLNAFLAATILLQANIISHLGYGNNLLIDPCLALPRQLFLRKMDLLKI